MEKFLKHRQWLWAALGADGIFLISSFSIRHQHFVSDLGGFLGCVLLVGAYLGFNWTKIKSHDRKTIASVRLILVLVIVLIGLEVVQSLLG